MFPRASLIDFSQKAGAIILMRAEDTTLMTGFLQGAGPSVQAVEGWVRASASAFRGRLGSEWEDCIQDCLLEATRIFRDGKFRGDSSLKTYLWRVTSNLCISRLRRRHRAAHDVLREMDLASGEASPLQETLRQDFGRIALEVWRRASEDCRHLWSMILDGSSYREMSESTGVSPGALRVRVLRCRRTAWELRSGMFGDGSNKSSNK
jgi:RNA polymerase sigma factor (sigma-70 family)